MGIQINNSSEYMFHNTHKSLGICIVTSSKYSYNFNDILGFIA